MAAVGEAKAAVPHVGAVVIAIDAEHVLEASLARDQEPVQALAANCADETLGVRVAFGAWVGVLTIVIASVPKTTSSVEVKLRVAITDQRGRRDAPIGQRRRTLTRLLGDPSRVGVRGLSGTAEIRA